MVSKTSKPIPTKLYRYERVSIQTLENLTNRIIWFSRPNNFNDPYDPAPPYPSDLNDDELQIAYDFFSNKFPDKSEHDARYLQDGKINDEFRLLLTKILIEGVEENLNVRDEGIACFSATHDDLLMWSHYGDGHRGYCLEFETTHDPFNRAREVVYSQNYPLVNLASVIADQFSKGEPYLLKELLLTKSYQWSYEQEWRIFDDGDTGFVYDESALTAIYFGSEVSSKHKKLIRQLITNPQTRLYNMQKARSSYKIEAHPLII